MTKTQLVLIERAQANGGMYRLDNPMALAAAVRIPADVAFVQSNVLVLVTKEQS